MNKSNLYLQITNGVWLIEPSAIQQLGPVVKSLLERGVDINAEIKQPEILIISAAGQTTYAGRYSNFNDATPGSTAVVKVSGVIMKQDNCGDPGTETLSNLVKQADQHPNISSIILMMDSPGGTVAGTESFSKVVKATQKPIIGAITGQMCSACYWIGSSCDEVYATNLTDQIGSIGTMMSFADAQPMWEKQGVVFHEIYASASTDKNKDFKQARKKNYTQVIERLDAINNIFLDAVKANRGDKLNQKETLSGKVFMAQDAINVGLIDGIKPLEDIIGQAQNLATNSTQSNDKPMKINSKFTAVIAAITASVATFKAEDEITEDHLAAVNTAFETQSTSITTLKNEKVELEKKAGELTAAQTTLIENKKEIDRLTAEVATLKSGNPGSTQTSKKETDATGSTNDSEAIIAALPHNQAVDQNPIFNKPAPAKKD